MRRPFSNKKSANGSDGFDVTQPDGSVTQQSSGQNVSAPPNSKKTTGDDEFFDALDGSEEEEEYYDTLSDISLNENNSDGVIDGTALCSNAPEVSVSKTESSSNVAATFKNDKYYSTQLSDNGDFKIVENLSRSDGQILAFALYNVDTEVKKTENSAEYGLTSTYKVAGFKMDANAAPNKSYTLNLQNGGFNIEVYADHARLCLNHFFEKLNRKDGPININETFEYTCKPNKPEDGTEQITPGVIFLMDSNAINLNLSLCWPLNKVWDQIKNSTAKSSGRIDRTLFPAFEVTFASSKNTCNLTIRLENIGEVLKELAKNLNDTVAQNLNKMPFFGFGVGKAVGSILSKVTDGKTPVPLPLQDVLIKGEVLNKIFKDIQSTKDNDLILDVKNIIDDPIINKHIQLISCDVVAVPRSDQGKHAQNSLCN